MAGVWGQRHYQESEGRALRREALADRRKTRQDEGNTQANTEKPRSSRRGGRYNPPDFGTK